MWGAVVAAPLRAAPTAAPTASGVAPVAAAFIENYCAGCHDDIEKKSDLDLTSLAFSPKDPKNFALWVKVHDRVRAGEMPPKKKPRPPPGELEQFVASLGSTLTAAERELYADGRATRRRLNRYEYENALRDLLAAPWLQVRDSLPEDGEAFRFNKVGDALDVSHVQLARYLGAAEYALRQVVAKQPERPATTTTRYYAREQRSFVGPMKFTVFNTAPERATFPVLGGEAQPDVRQGKAPVTVGASEPATRELEGVGLVASTYEPLEPKFSQFKAPVAGHYKIRLNAFSVWVGPGKRVPGKPDRWWVPDLDDISHGRRPEPITVYSEIPPRQLRWLGNFDVAPDPTVHELDVWLLEGETIRPDAARLFRSRPGAGRWQNPLAEKDGQPGVVFRWLEVEGPLYDEWPTAGHKLLFGDLPLRVTSAAPTSGAPLPVRSETPARDRGRRRSANAAGAAGQSRTAAVTAAAPAGPAFEIVSDRPMADAPRLLGRFIARAYRRPVPDGEVRRFLPVVENTLQAGGNFADAMIAGYTAVLCSPEFVSIDEQPGKLDDYAIAARLSFFLANSSPDAELRRLAAAGQLHDPRVLHAQTDRLLNDPKAGRFVDAFLDYWLDLRRMVATAPDEVLYNDYYLDDLLTESALAETRAFFTELIRGDLPARNLVSSDFVFANERLAAHYGLPPVEGVALRKVAVPPGSLRGGLLTQAAVLKVTANGTTTSPVLRGAWIMERILGQPPPPPPPNLPAVEPDIRGASTIRQQLDKHRTQESCAACHARIDPPGLALEAFDVMGGFRDRYRAMGDAATNTNPGSGTAAVLPAPGIGRGGQKFQFHYALPVDCTGELWDGRKFADVRELERLLLDDERQIARNLVRQFVVYATGAPVRFSDRPVVEKILDHAQSGGWGVRSLVHEVVQSELFLNK